jgi:hypothetical protein
VKIKVKDGSSLSEIQWKLQLAIDESRFTMAIVERDGAIILSNVRLRESKPYCGNHPNACELGGRDKKAKWLEGADWVGFNDMVNDVLDTIGVNAHVASDLVVIRKGQERCVEYTSTYRRFWQWDKHGRYENWIGRLAPRSEYPYGTPGLAEWRNNVTKLEAA